jgi:hypothetical protein
MSMRVRIGIVKALVHPGELRGLVHLRDELLPRLGALPGPEHAEQSLEERWSPGRVPAVLVHLGPALQRLQGDDRFHHRERCGVGGRLGTTDLAEDRTHLGEAVEDRVLPLELARGLADRQVRHRRGHEEEVAFVQRRHKLAAQLEKERNGRNYCEDADQNRRDGLRSAT